MKSDLRDRERENKAGTPIESHLGLALPLSPSKLQTSLPAVSPQLQSKINCRGELRLVDARGVGEKWAT